MSDELGVDPFDGETLDLIVPGTLDAIRVDRVLSMLTGLSRSETSAMLASGAVRIDDKVVVKASMNVETGQHLVAVLPLADSGDVAPDPTVEVDIVVDDEDFCVVNKAPGQVVHPGAGQRTGTLVAGLLARYPQMADLVATGLCEPLRPGIVHRLDKGTSGVMVVAKTPEGFISLSTQLSERLIERTYLGMVEGHVAEERGVVDAPIGRSMRTPTMMAVRADGRPARTGYEVLARIDKPNAMTLLRLGLDTGRTHQIRVHMAKIGHPIVNDARYGHRRERRLDEDRFFLHSTTLSFTHPRTDELVVTHVALPDDLRVLVPEGLEL
jgi:23S rRNA pseudouridine1911/1915/1917 synthase